MQLEAAPVIDGTLSLVEGPWMTELYAFLEALLWLRENSELWEKAMLLSHSQSSLMSERSAHSGRRDELL